MSRRPCFLRVRPIARIAVAAALNLLVPAAFAETVPMSPDRWDVEGATSFAVQDGRPALRLGGAPDQRPHGAEANLRGVNFSTGIVEFDFLQGPGVYDFAGLA